MHIAISGGTGLVGHAIVREALHSGHALTVLGRKRPRPGLFPAPVGWLKFDLDASSVPDLGRFTVLIHCALDHTPGCYRGGEGGDPTGFLRRNVLGSSRLVQSAGEAGCRVIFLSSRAVYGSWPPGTILSEAMTPRPDTLYGEAKLVVEQVVAKAGGVSLRATGVYGPPGPGQTHKWTALFSDFATGQLVAPRKATEVHSADLAAACLLAARQETPPVLNVSDLMLDRRDLLKIWAEVTGITGRLPQPVPGPGPAEMDIALLKSLGWSPRGRTGLRRTLVEIASQEGAVNSP